MPWTRQQLFDHLDKLAISYKTVEHPPLFTVEESQALRGEIPGAHTKNLFLKCKKGSFWLITALETTPVDLKTLHKKLECGRLSFGNADLLMEMLGITPGAVSTFCAINDTGRRVNIVLDRNLQDHALINLHPLENTATTTIAYADLIRFLEDCGHPPKITDLAE